MNTDSNDKSTNASIKLSECRSRGKEPYVFRAESPDGLIGVHADLIAASLKWEEKLHYLIYSPIREADGSPFGIHAEPASHALAVTDHRFLISKNMHTDNIPPTVQAIPFSQVVCVDIGNALLLGWLAIRFIENGRLHQTSLFYSALGSHHFEAAICTFRKISGKTENHVYQEGNMTRSDFWKQIPKPQIEILKSVLLKEENPLYFLWSTERWGTEKRKRNKICLAANGVLLVTNCGLLHVLEERPISPNILSYGVNICIIPPAAVHSAACVEKEEYGIRQQVLRLKIGNIQVWMNYDIPFDRNNGAEVADFIRAKA